MPKEYTHFRIAERSAGLLAGTRFGADLVPLQGRVRAALLLGSVFHDAPYYLETPGREESESLLELPHLLHGKKGRDTHALLRAQAAHAAALNGSPEAKEARAFLVGLASHLCADATLHPMVFHLTGDYFGEPGAVERHRLLESCLDLAVAGSRAELRSRRLTRLLRSCDPVPLAPLDFLGVLSGNGNGGVNAALRRAWRTFSRMQFLALSPLGAALARLRPLLPQKSRLPREILALLYPDAASAAPILEFLSGRISYLHPVTGEPRSASIEELMEEASQKTVRLCAALEPAAFGDADPSGVIGRGPGLDTGLGADFSAEAGTNQKNAPQDEADGFQNANRLRHFARPRFPRI
ncbi:zinc dependent phospholipase C family protein [Paucidesulfovibrio longus]|uniref:zinc dependent phospholipase C family protein n=1 Tax=Paucidesulfovibrio longus TaxID=889 RepID=UPI0003B3065C|nr:zinc dependent phospholipase C family protein [Paucidesulfovibrio longus]